VRHQAILICCFPEAFWCTRSLPIVGISIITTVLAEIVID